MKYLALIVLVLLAGCATAPQEVIKTVSVPVPVPVPCIVSPISVPDWELAKVRKSDNNFVWAQAAVVEIEQHKAYEVRLNSAISACQK